MSMKATLITLLLVSAVAMPAAAGTVLGQTALNNSKVDGALVPAGTTVLSPSKIETGAYPGTVHLSTGQTLNLGPNSSARLEAAPGGRISLAAESGLVQIGTETGEVFKLAANTVALLDEEEPGSGTAVVKIEVCDADDSLITWDATSLDTCLKCYLPNDDGECKGDKGGGAWYTSTGGIIGITAAALGAGYLIADSGTETKTVACGVPDASGNVPPGTNPPGVGGCP